MLPLYQKAAYLHRAAHMVLSTSFRFLPSATCFAGLLLVALFLLCHPGLLVILRLLLRVLLLLVLRAVDTCGGHHDIVGCMRHCLV